MISKTVWAMVAFFSATLLMSAILAVRVSDACDAQVTIIMEEEVPYYWMFCEGTCVLNECHKDVQLYGEQCLCGTYPPTNVDCRGRYSAGQGLSANYDNMWCERAGCWTQCNKVSSTEVPEFPYGIKMCKCPPVPPD